MKQITILLISAMAFTMTATAQTTEENEMDRVSYSLGVLVAQNLKQQGIEGIDAASMAKAINDVLEGKETEISTAEAQQIFQAHSQALQAKKFEANKTAGEAYLAENATKEGVTVTASGLQYEVMTMGEGPKPAATDKVTVHYHGTLIDGKVFDSSVQRGNPATFPLNGVIKGWTEGVQLMPVGSKFKFTIPYNLAYGERGAGADIGPFSTLVFEVELISIN